MVSEAIPALFGPEMDAYGSIDVSGCTENNKIVARDTQSTIKFDQKHLQAELWTIRFHFG